MTRLGRARTAALTLVGTAIALLVGCGSEAGVGSGRSPRAATTTVAIVESADRAGPVDLGDGRGIYLQCQGTGTPTVVLVSGFADGADAWSGPLDATPSEQNVYADVGRFTRVCSYERPGTGERRSMPVPQPTSAQDAAADLERLLSASGEPGPYVLVGHSYGGPIIRLFASDDPADVAALVLVDGLSEDLPDGLTAAQREVFEALNSPPAEPGAEALDFDATFEQLRALPPPPDVPVIVLTADRPQLTPEVLASGRLPAGVDRAFADALWAAQVAAQEELAAKFPGAEHITDTHSTHYIQDDNPQLVIDSIRDVVDIVRDDEPGS
jgi:pimeloyl-ACP methyl ester carboxylesterase